MTAYTAPLSVSFIRFVYNRLTSKCYSVAFVEFSLYFVIFVITMP